MLQQNLAEVKESLRHMNLTSDNRMKAIFLRRVLGISRITSSNLTIARREASLHSQRSQNLEAGITASVENLRGIVTVKA